MFDTCGTGGDRAHTFNVSTVAALVLAACGVRVAKHGNRSVSSRCGSADLFEALGVNIAAEPAVVERCLDEAGIAFFFAPTFHPSMRHAAPTRKELGVRTAFNLLGPLTNPAGASRQLVGVPRPELTELVARSLALLGSERAWVVHGADGLDEISTTGYTKVSECRDGAVNTFYVHPSDFGLPKAAPGGSCAAAMPRRTPPSPERVLAGERGAARDIVLLNAGASLLIAERRRIRSGGHRRGGGGARQRPRGGGARAARAASPTGTGGGVMMTTAPDLLGDDRGGDAAHRRSPRSGTRRRARSHAQQTRTPRGAAFARGASRRRADAARHRRVQAAFAVDRASCARTTTRRRTRARTPRPAPRRFRC